MSRPIADFTWKPALFYRQTIALFESHIRVTTTTPFSSTFLDFKYTMLDSYPLRIIRRKIMGFVLGVFSLFMLLFATVALVKSPQIDPAAAVYQVMKIAGFLIATCFFFVHYWRHNGTFLCYRYRGGHGTAFMVPKNHRTREFTDLVSRTIHTGGSLDSAAAAAPEVHDSIDDRMAQAEHLRKEGLISEEEFQDLKKLFGAGNRRG